MTNKANGKGNNLIFYGILRVKLSKIALNSTEKTKQVLKIPQKKCIFASQNCRPELLSLK